MAESEHTGVQFEPVLRYAPPHGKHLYYLALGALGIFYGDIGTSPLYALRESFHAAH
ncbi:MAG: KUP/HAK/KT family potassium transporter, partial [Caldilinea sp.]